VSHRTPAGTSACSPRARYRRSALKGQEGKREVVTRAPLRKVDDIMFFATIRNPEGGAALIETLGLPRLRYIIAILPKQVVADLRA
jgi:hypothetical protein